MYILQGVQDGLKLNEEKDGWRCTDGRCIELSKRGNGMPDCLDNSDETARK